MINTFNLMLSISGISDDGRNVIVHCRNHSLNDCCNTGRLSDCHITSPTTADVAANARLQGVLVVFDSKGTLDREVLRQG
ncbi:hypothetical protein ACIJH7_004150 [Yersinia enterocolitica]